jgi:hypothetical protein
VHETDHEPDAPDRAGSVPPRRHGLAVAFACAAACTVEVALVADRATAKRLRTKTIASGKGRIGAAGTVKFRARLTGAAQKRIGRLKRGSATLMVTVVESGKAEQLSKFVALRR